MTFEKEELFATTQASGCIDVLVPRCLIGNGANICGLPVDLEGLCSLRLSWKDGKISSIKGIPEDSKLPNEILLPRFTEPHAHIDKAFTWNRSPNLRGSYEGALEANLRHYEARSEEDLLCSSEKSLDLAFSNGIRAIRSHIDSFGKNALKDWDLIGDVRKKWQEKILLQYVALVPLEFWETYEGELLAKRVAFSGDLLGGVVAPPYNKKKTFKSLVHLIQLANQLDCDIDLHIDESQSSAAAGLKLLLKALEQVENKVSITCSHLSSMALLGQQKLSQLAAKMYTYKVNVVALPLTNSWLLGRKDRSTLIKRPLAPIFELQKAGVVVAVGGDNVNDSWFPLSSFDPINLMAFSMSIAHLSPWDRLGLSPFSTSAAHLLGLEWKGYLEIGSPADWVLLDSNSWVEALSSKPKKRVVVKGNFLD